MFGLDPTLITFSIYIFGMILIGVLAYYYTNNLSDYILGGRKLGSFVTAMSAGASDMSGWLLMGLPGAVYVSGLVEGWIAIGLILGAYFNWLLVAGRLRIYTEFNNNALTLPEYFHHRFGTSHNLLKIVSATIILAFFTIYCASGVVAGAKLFQNLFSVEYSTAIWYGALATIIYTFIGGFLAVSWTDTIQATLMIFALILTPLFILLSLGDTSQFTEVLHQAEIAANKDFTDLFTATTPLGLLSLAAWGLGYFGQPHILARFMAAYSVKSLIKARRISMTWMVICLAGAIGIGFFGIPYFFANPGVASVVNNAQDEKSKVLKLVEFAWAGFGSAFGPVVLFSLFWKRMTSSAAMAGMVVGAVVVFAWKSVIPQTSEWFNVYEMIPGFALASLAIIVVSLLSGEPENEVKETFEKAEKAYKEAK